MRRAEDPCRTRWTRNDGGVRSREPEEVGGAPLGETYYVGIIDILQEYNMRKKCEKAYKVQGSYVSTVAPSAQRSS